MSGLAELPALEPTDAFLDAAAAFAITFDADDLRQMGRFLAMLLETNKQFNLTAIKDPADAWRKHVLDSLTLLPWIAAAAPKRVADVGTGGGLPGIPLAIACPEIRFTLIEATGKKAKFVQDAAAALALRNVMVINDRAETVGCGESCRERFDMVTARAVGRLPVVVELCVPLARVGGHVLAIKGGRATGEIKEAARALRLLRAEVADAVTTPTGTVVVIEKKAPTPKTYPRRPGEPKKTPL